MKRASLISTALATAVVLSIPTIAWSRVNLDVSNNQDLADTVMLNHHGGTHHGSHGRGGCCW
jgi:hypothetical protein